MNTRVWLSGLVLAFLGLGPCVHGQGPARPGGREVLPAPTPESNNAPAAPPGPANGPSTGKGTSNGAPNGNGTGNGEPSGPSTDPTSQGPGVSSWLAHGECNCCGPLGRDGPISPEVYARTGVSIPFGGGTLSGHASPGFMGGAGVRTLFFNPAADTAWTIDLGGSTAWYSPNNNPPTVTIRNPNFNPNGAMVGINQPTARVQPKTLNESFFNLALGHEYYLWGSGACTACADGCAGPNWRVGWDLGGRYGTGKLALQPNAFFIRPRTATLAGFLLAVHTDLEFPTGCCIFFVGVRAEYGWVFGQFLGAGNDTDLQAANLLLNVGLRF